MKYLSLNCHLSRGIIDNSNIKFYILKLLPDPIPSLQVENETRIPFQHHPKGTRYPKPLQGTQKPFLYRYQGISRLQQIHPIQGALKSL